MFDRLVSVLVAGPREGSAATAAFCVRLAGGLVFVAFGLVKFTSHASEVASFRDYGLPSPEVFVSVIGVLEIVGGLLLIGGLVTRLAALALVGDMVGAVITSGIGEGELISLTLAPAELLGMLFLLRTGPGRAALDHRFARGPATGPRSAG